MDQKADLDFKAAVRLSADAEFREVVGFHAQQAVEKYLKALLTQRQIEFPKTHVIRRAYSFCWSRLIQRSRMPLMRRIG